MNEIELPSHIPTESVDLLHACLGKRILRLVRHSWWPAEQVAGQCNIRDEQAFSLTAGPLAIYFEDGTILGLASEPPLVSVVVWDEAERKAGRHPYTMDQDEELFPITDSGRFAGAGWQQFAGQILKEIIVLERAPKNAKEESRPREAGLRFRCENGRSFVASHGLHDGSDDFSVLEESQLGKAALKPILTLSA